MLLGIVKTVKDTVLSEEQTSQTEDVLKETANNAINDVLKTTEGYDNELVIKYGYLASWLTNLSFKH